jgi:hypothetical protein
MGLHELLNHGLEKAQSIPEKSQLLRLAESDHSHAYLQPEMSKSLFKADLSTPALPVLLLRFSGHVFHPQFVQYGPYLYGGQSV